VNRLTEVPARRNAITRDNWTAYANHRRTVTGHLAVGRAPGCDRLCVLGAGNANDLELPILAVMCREVHLVDLDADALALGIARRKWRTPKRSTATGAST